MIEQHIAQIVVALVVAGITGTIATFWYLNGRIAKVKEEGKKDVNDLERSINGELKNLNSGMSTISGHVMTIVARLEERGEIVARDREDISVLKTMVAQHEIRLVQEMAQMKSETANQMAALREENHRDHMEVKEILSRIKIS